MVQTFALDHCKFPVVNGLEQGGILGLLSRIALNIGLDGIKGLADLASKLLASDVIADLRHASITLVDDLSDINGNGLVGDINVEAAKIILAQAHFLNLELQTNVIEYFDKSVLMLNILEESNTIITHGNGIVNAGSGQDGTMHEGVSREGLIGAGAPGKTTFLEVEKLTINDVCASAINSITKVVGNAIGGLGGSALAAIQATVEGLGELARDIAVPLGDIITEDAARRGRIFRESNDFTKNIATKSPVVSALRG